MDGHENSRRAPVYPVAHGNDGIQVIEINGFSLRFDFNSSMFCGYFHFGNNHFLIQFAVFKNVL